MIKRFYPCNEQVLLQNNVSSQDLYEYIFHGFALASIEGVDYYVSYAFTKPQLLIPCDDVTQKDMIENCGGEDGVLSTFIKSSTKLKLIQIHYGDTTIGHAKVAELLKQDYSLDAFSRYKLTFQAILRNLFPTYE